MKNKIDVVIDLAYGDTGKGCVANDLASRPEYTHVLRFNGSGNAGHTIYNFGKKFVTHLVPCGVFHKKRSIIGSGCVIHPEKLKEEIRTIEAENIDVRSYLKIANNAHVVQDKHLTEDSQDVKVGTTKQGVGPCYRDKYGRVGLRAEDVFKNDPVLGPMLVDMHHEFHILEGKNKVVAEGAQGFYLDIDWGDYPYVTSSHCQIGSVLLNGFGPKSISDVYGIIKAYDTYVGAKEFQPKDEPLLDTLQELGGEVGATTGRKRQCNWLNLDNTIKAIRMNGVTHLVVKKGDILRELDVYKMYYQGKLQTFIDVESMYAEIANILQKEFKSEAPKFIASENKYGI